MQRLLATDQQAYHNAVNMLSDERMLLDRLSTIITLVEVSRHSGSVLQLQDLPCMGVVATSTVA